MILKKKGKGSNGEWRATVGFGFYLFRSINII
jgi:hypothetical protein